MDLTILFPKQCVLCNRYGSYLCDFCLRHFTNLLPTCPTCHKLSSQFKLHKDCNKRYFDSSISLYKLDVTTKRIIHSVRDKGATKLLDILLSSNSKHMEWLFRPFNKETTVLISACVNKYEALSRGFIESALITKYISNISGLRIIDSEYRRDYQSISDIIIINNLLINQNKNKEEVQYWNNKLHTKTHIFSLFARDTFHRRKIANKFINN